MGRVVQLKHMRQDVSGKVAEKAKSNSVLEQAFQELRAQNGLDYKKLLRCDERETQRFRMRQYQEAMQE